MPGEGPAGCPAGTGDVMVCHHGYKKATKVFIEEADVAQLKAEWFEDACQ